MSCHVVQAGGQHIGLLNEVGMLAARMPEAGSCCKIRYTSRHAWLSRKPVRRLSARLSPNTGPSAVMTVILSASRPPSSASASGHCWISRLHKVGREGR